MGFLSYIADNILGMDTWNGREQASQATNNAYRKMTEGIDNARDTYNQYYPGGDALTPYDRYGQDAIGQILYGGQPSQTMQYGPGIPLSQGSQTGQQVGVSTGSYREQGRPASARYQDMLAGNAMRADNGMPQVPGAPDLQTNYDVQNFGAPGVGASSVNYNLDFDKYANDPRLAAIFDQQLAKEQEANARASSARGNFLSSFSANRDTELSQENEAAKWQQALAIAQNVAQGNLSASQSNAANSLAASQANARNALSAQSMQQAADRGYAGDQFQTAQQNYQNALAGYGLQNAANADQYRRGYETTGGMYDIYNQQRAFDSRNDTARTNALMGLAQMGYNAAGAQTGLGVDQANYLADLDLQRGLAGAQKYGTIGNIETNLSNHVGLGQGLGSAGAFMGAMKGMGGGQNFTSNGQQQNYSPYA